MQKILFLGLITFSLIACSSSQDEKVQETQDYSAFPFEGMFIPGTLKDAKKTGFTECESSYSGYECSQKNPKEFFGVMPSKIYVVLNGNDNFNESFSSSNVDVRSIPQDKLSYKQIYLDIPQDTYNQKCLEKNNLSEFSYPPTIQCIETKGVHFLQHYLNKNGWFESEQRSNYSYVKENMPITIYIDRNDDVSIAPSSIKENQERIQRIKEQEIKEQNIQKNADTIMQNMKEDI